jgi:hypothetical protein
MSMNQLNGADARRAGPTLIGVDHRGHVRLLQLIGRLVKAIAFTAIDPLHGRHVDRWWDIAYG